MKSLLTTPLVILALLAPLNAGADFDKGQTAFDAEDQATIEKELKKAAEQGDASAQYNLGNMYLQGSRGVRKDWKKAAKWIRLAAEQGDTQAQYLLGSMYRSGWGVIQHYKEAAKWYRLAAEKGHGLAHLMLGLMYYEGEGVLQDIVYAHMWLNIAGSKGFDGGKTTISTVAEQMTPAQIAEAQKLARECVAKEYKGC